MSKCLTGNLAKISQNIFAYFCSKHSASFSLEKKIYFVADRGLTPPPPLTNQSANNIFFYVFPKVD